MTITEVSRQYNLSADTLRYYERVGLIPTVNRTKGGIRDYDEASCNWVSFIKCMRNAGVQIEALIDYVSLFQQGDSTRDARKQILLEQESLLESKIAELQGTLNYLKDKIARYDQWTPAFESEMNSHADE